MARENLNHRLPIEQDSFWGVERDDRICDLCNSCIIGDEYHYLFECNFFDSDRLNYLPQYVNNRPNTLKYSQLFSSENYDVLVKVAKFCKIILLVVNCNS